MAGLMRRLRDLFGVESRVAGDGNWKSVGSTPGWLVGLLNDFGMSSSGVSVTEVSTLQLTAAYCAINLIARTMAALPLPVYRRDADGGRSRASNHPAYSLLHDRAHPLMTSMVFRETMMAHVLVFGNGYAKIVRDPISREPWRLEPWVPDHVGLEITDDGTQMMYSYRKPPGGAITDVANSEDMLHFKGLGGNGLVGWSPIKCCMSAIGLGLATQEFGANFFGNGARPSGALKHPGTLSEPAHDRLKHSFAANYGGVKNVGKPMILEEGLDWTSISIPPEEAQFLQTRQFNIAEVARIYNVPPHKLKDLSRSTYSNIEQQSIDFVNDTLMPWLVTVEQEFNYKLFKERERGEFFCEHVVQGLLRGDAAARTNYYNSGLDRGWLSPNDVRKLENLNPIEDGDEYVRALNMAPLGTSPAQTGPPAAPSPQDMPPAPAALEPEGNASATEAIERLALLHVPMLADAIARMFRREQKALVRAAKKPDAFIDFVEDFYAKHQGDVYLAVRPAFDTFADARAAIDRPADPAWLLLAARTYALRHAQEARQTLLAVCDVCTPEMLADVVAEQLGKWTDALATERAQELLIGAKQYAISK